MRLTRLAIKDQEGISTEEYIAHAALGCGMGIASGGGCAGGTVGKIIAEAIEGRGTIYYDPDNPHNSIRVMPGNPNSQFTSQQNPYVIIKENGRALDRNGSQLGNSSLPEAHIPLDDFLKQK